MLHELLNYSVREGLESEPGFTPRWVRFLIVLDRSGQFHGGAQIPNQGVPPRP